MLEVLAAWDWAERPAGVVTLPSRSRPHLITALGQRIAAAGKLSYLGSLDYRNGGTAGAPVQQRPAAGRALAHPGRAR